MVLVSYITLLYIVLILHVIDSKKASCMMDGKNGMENVTGTITLVEKDNKLMIDYDLKGITPADTLHAFHIHEKGEISNSCMDAGGHFNPENKSHGGIKDEERHLGDFGNIKATSGKAKGTIKASDITLYGDNSVLGKAFVLHKGIDDLGRKGDEGSKKTGNAGARLQCCIITKSAAGLNSISLVFIPIITFVSFLANL